jgi:hypothetical protein
MRISRRSQRTNPVQGLRLAIDCLPVATRKAMLDGIGNSERILVGAYVDGDGGVCPMLAAHRCGGRTDFLSFAKSWDRFGRSRGRARAATEREVRILVNQLEASLGESDGLDLDAAIAEHRRLQAASRPDRERPRRLRVLDPVGTIIARRLRTPTHV